MGGGGGQQSARWCCLSTGCLGGAGGGGGSFHTASLNWCFQSRNVSSFGTCFVFLCFQHTSRLHSRSSPCSSLWNAKPCVQGWYSVWRLKPSPLNVALCCSAWRFFVYVVETSETKRVHTFVSFTLPVLLWGMACLSFPEELTF